MLCYMDGLRGNQRGLAKERAEKMMVQTESDRDQSKGPPSPLPRVPVPVFFINYILFQLQNQRLCTRELARLSKF